ncbi:MAG: hypothetical protein ABJC89_07155 [Acidobacteriota bacterium]
MSGFSRTVVCDGALSPVNRSGPNEQRRRRRIETALSERTVSAVNRRLEDES